MTSPQPNQDPIRRNPFPQTNGVRSTERPEGFESLSRPALTRSIDPLRRGIGAPEYYSAMLTVLQDAKNQVPFSVPAAARAHLEELELIEWSADYPTAITPKNVPFFSSDEDLHKKIDKDQASLDILTQLSDVTPVKRPRGRPRKNKEPTQFEEKRALMAEELEGLRDQLQKRHDFHSLETAGGFLRLTKLGRTFVDSMFKQSEESSLLIVKSVLQLGEKAPLNRIYWPELFRHVAKLGRLPDTELHYRKLYFGVVTGSLDLTSEGLKQRYREIEAEHYADVFLSAPMSGQGMSALRWLNKQDGGNYCPFPYPSWRTPEKRECEAESRKIVTRSRQLSYWMFRKLRLETKRIGGEDGLLARFARENHEKCFGVHGSNLDVPPGRGVFFSGPRLEKLFHSDPAKPHDALASYRESFTSWFQPALPLLEETSVLALRGWIAVMNPCKEFEQFGTRYCFLVDNHHLSPLYGLTFGFPEKIVTRKIRPCLYDLDFGNPADDKDLTHQDASIPGLIKATREAGLPPLVFGTMSQLFGGMANALPVGFAPTLNWETSRQGDLWKDVYNHVHWSWLVWQHQDHRPKVDHDIAPMIQKDKELREFVTTGQQLLAAVMDRYNAWKSNFTPGIKSAPRMLAEAYRIHRAFKAGHPSVPKDETLYIGAYDVENPGGKPAPWINCFKLEIMRKKGKPIKLPDWSDGSENQELNLWRKHIYPLLVEAGDDGRMREGRYEMAIIGDKDL